MIEEVISSGVLLDLSKLFTYPEVLVQDEDLTCIQHHGGHNLKDIGRKVGLQGLQEEYVRLFVNSLPEIPCPPYGSFYLEGTLMGQGTVKLYKIYQEYGLEPEDLPDHIAVELEFLSLLAGLIKENKKEIVEKDYLEVISHLKSWGHEFWEEVKKHDKTGYYLAASKMAQMVLYN